MDLNTMSMASMDLDTVGLNEYLIFNSNLDGSTESSQPLEHNFLTTSPGFSPTSDFIGSLLEDDKFYEALGLPGPGLDKKQIEGIPHTDAPDSLPTTPLTEWTAPLVQPSSMVVSPVPSIPVRQVAAYPEETGDSMLSSKRNTRKSSLTSRQASASPSIEFGSSSEVIIPKTRSRSIKQEELKPVVKKSLKRESKSPVSDAAGIAEERKRQKMYERKDDPACKNAKAARANREKKKELMDKLQHENSELALANEKNEEKLSSLELSNQQLKEELEKMKRKNLAATGLKRIFTSAKSLLEDIMPPLIKKHGKWSIEAAPWLSQVAIENTDENHTSLTASMNNPTSEYITLHVNVPKRIVKVDYRHEDPILPNIMPL